MGGAGRGMGVPGMHPGGVATGGPGAAAMMPGGMNSRPAGMGMTPGNYPYQGGMGPAGQGQVGSMGMQPRPAAPPQYNPPMYQQPGQMPGMVQPNRYVGGQPGKCCTMLYSVRKLGSSYCSYTRSFFLFCHIFGAILQSERMIRPMKLQRKVCSEEARGSNG